MIKIDFNENSSWWLFAIRKFKLLAKDYLLKQKKFVNTRTILEENLNKTILKEERFKLVLLTKLNYY